MGNKIKQRHCLPKTTMAAQIMYPIEGGYIRGWYVFDLYKDCYFYELEKIVQNLASKDCNCKPEEIKVLDYKY